MKAISDLAAANARVEELRAAIDRADAHHNTEIARLERIIDQITQPKPTLLERISGAIQIARGV